MSRTNEISDKIITAEKLQQLLTRDEVDHKTLVFTNGCFDILHPGHIHLLREAADMGDLLVVGLNSDDSVRRLKGPERPLNDEASRALLLSSLVFVDFVVLFSEDTPLNLIKQLKPEILVKGGDYRPEEIVGYEFLASIGGKTVTVPLLKGHSTTGLIDKSKKR